MIYLKENMNNKYKGALVNCDACDMGVPESQTHVMTWELGRTWRKKGTWNLDECVVYGLRTTPSEYQVEVAGAFTHSEAI